jgi:hypothetical protein
MASLSFFPCLLELLVQSAAAAAFVKAQFPVYPNGELSSRLAANVFLSEAGCGTPNELCCGPAFEPDQDSVRPGLFTISTLLSWVDLKY